LNTQTWQPLWPLIGWRQAGTGWWDDNVTPNRGGDRRSGEAIKNAVRGTWSYGDIERETGISNQQATGGRSPTKEK
jgi:hypothetical protein